MKILNTDNENLSSILIVDDNTLDILYLKLLLEQLHVNILSASSGPEALGIIKNQDLALALIDISMPGMSGIELTSKITSDDTRDRIPIILMTAFSYDRELHKRCYEAGAVDYIMKPFISKILISKVSVFIELDRQKRQLIKSRVELETMSADLFNIFNLSVDLVCVYDYANNSLIKTNPAFTKTLGYQPEELYGNNIIELMHPEDFISVNEKLNSVRKSESDNIQFESRFCCKDGSYKWIVWVAKPVWESGIAYAIGHDVTIRKQYEEQILASEKLYRTLVNTSPEGIIIMDLDGMITDVSDLSIDLLEGIERNEFIGIPFREIVVQSDWARLMNTLQRTLEEGLVQNEEFILVTKKNVRLITEISLALIQHTDEKPKAFMAIIRDIRERREVEQQLIQSERLSAIGVIAASVAHEINQPLNNISLSLDNILYTLDHETNPEKKYLKEKSENIFKNIHRMEHIIDHIRTFSRGEDITFENDFNVNDSIKNALLLVSAQYNSRNIALRLDLDPEIPLLKGNTYKLEQVIINLLSNARDAVEEKQNGAGTDYQPEVRIMTRSDPSVLFIEVSDNGAGIPDEMKEKIMLPFFSTKQEGKGTGLGLSISSRIIKEMKGNIRIESKLGYGTSIHVNIPLLHKNK